jgi:hypothetical protein
MAIVTYTGVTPGSLVLGELATTEVDFLPIAANPGSNVDTQADYAGAGYQVNGFPSGQTLSAQFNKTLRQGSVWAAALANFVAVVLNQPVLDQGYASAGDEVSALLAQFESALLAYVANSTAPSVVVVTFSATPTFDCSVGNLMRPVFQITLTGDVTAPTLVNQQPGQSVKFIVKQDSAGSHAFAWPAGMNQTGSIDAAPNSVSVQSFVVDSTSTLQAESSIVG